MLRPDARHWFFLVCPTLLTALLVTGCDTPSPPVEPTPTSTFPGLAHERYTLDNGLEVVLHEDHSDPIVAVATIVHVGSSRERLGRTGFAHFFEHMSFNDSENVPRGANRKLIPELGGTRNGGTSSDMTIYYEVVPKDAFEKILWIDSDRLGFMINTVTEAALEREKQVVKNEKRQRVDNAPYGHTRAVQQAALYPENHPYHWTVVGSLDDLQSATLEDVQSFYTRLYGANNATLVIAGDIEIGETKRLVEYWFSEIRQGPTVTAPYPQPVYLEATRSLMYEDTFATLPELQLVFPTVEQFHEDHYTLDLLASLLADSRESPLYQVVVEEQRLAPAVAVGHRAAEIAGELVFRVRAGGDTDLDSVVVAIDEALARFERDGIDAEALARVKVQAERSLHERIGSVLDKAFELAEGNEFAGDPNHIATIADRTEAVTAEDVMGAYQRYIKDRPRIMTSFVPRGRPELALEGAERARVVEEEILQGAEAEVSQGEEARYRRTPTEADRSEPPLGDPPLASAPEVWQSRLDNGLELYGIEHRESELVEFDLTIPGGQLQDPDGRTGVAGLLASLLQEGTARRTPAELEAAIDLLGARINISAGRETIRLRGSTLARTFEPTMNLVGEMLLRPRWDEDEFERLTRELATRLKDRESSPPAIASDVFYRLLYGDDHAFGTPPAGTPATTASITLADLQSYYERVFSPSLATFHVAGAVNRQDVEGALAELSTDWASKPVDQSPQPTPASAESGRIYFVDVQDAKQSVLMAGRLALSAEDDEWIRLDFANERIGGSSSGRLFQLLRIEKGYTYGARSSIGTTREVAPWVAQTSVRTNVTLESLTLLQKQIREYADTFTESDVTLTTNQVIKGNTRAFESLGAKLGLLRQMSRLGKPADFVERDQETLLSMTLTDFRETITTHLDEGQMIYVVVGDAETQLGQIAELGLGEPVEVSHGR